MSGQLPSIIPLVIADFRAMFKAFVDPNAYPDSVINMFFADASNYISTNNYGVLNNQARQLALYRMTAHLISLNDMIAEDGGAPAANIQSATVDKVRVDLTPPVEKSAFGSWLCFTPYGQTLWAMLQRKAVGGFYINPANAPLAAYPNNSNGPWPQ
jgi:hypothetical protein